MPYKIIDNKDGTFKLINKITGHVFAKNSTKENINKQLKLLRWVDSLKKKGKDINFIHIGGKLSISSIHNFLHNSYAKKKENNIDGYKKDNELSGTRFQAYYHPENNHLVTVHKGTDSWQDWLTDLRLGLFNDKSGKRFKHAKEMQKKAEDKYKTDNVTVLGHSLGSKLAEEAGKNAKEVITLNGATTPYDIGKKVNSNQTNIRTTLDPVSVLQNLQPDNGNNVNISSKTYNPLTEHSTATLKRLDPNMYIGN